MAPNYSRPGRGAPRHRWSWFADKASGTKIALWSVIVAAVVGLAPVLAPLWTTQAGSGPGAPSSNTPTPPTPSGLVTPSATPPTVRASPPPKSKPLTSIPRELLLYHNAAALNPCAAAPVCWNHYDTTQFITVMTFSIVQCQPFNVRDVQYAEGQALQRSDANNNYYFETVILYPNKEAAARVMDSLRKAIDGCPSAPADDGSGRIFRRSQTTRQLLGDESFWAGLQAYSTSTSPMAGGIRSQVTRRGSVLVVYTDVSYDYTSAPQTQDFAKVEDDTKSILPELCKFDPVC